MSLFLICNFNITDYINYEEYGTSTGTPNERFLNGGGKHKRMIENERKSLDRAWPTEKSTAYHLGGTRYWELEFVTEPSVSYTTIDKSKTIEVSNARTTCFQVILKNERNGGVKSNIFHHKSDVYSDRPRKNVSIGKQNAGLRDVTKKNTLRYKVTRRPVARKLKRDSQKLRGRNYSKRSSEERRTMGFNDFRRTSDGGSITAESRKLYGVNASKLRREIVKQTSATSKRKKKQSAKSRALQNVNSLHNADNCVASSRVKETDDEKCDEEITHLNVIEHKNKSISALHEREVHNCFNCICDIASVVSDIKSLLSRTSFPLDEIRALHCSEYKETQENKMVISMDSDVEEAREFPPPHYNVESLKGQKYIKLEELENNFKSDLESDSGIANGSLSI